MGVKSNKGKVCQWVATNQALVDLSEVINSLVRNQYNYSEDTARLLSKALSSINKSIVYCGRKIKRG